MFPAYKNTANGICYNESTVRDVINHTPAGMRPREPSNRAIWVLPEEFRDDADPSFTNHMFIMHLLKIGNTRLASERYYETKHSMKHFSAAMVADFFEGGMETEARDMYHATKRYALKLYDVDDIVLLYYTGMHDEARDLHLRLVRELATKDFGNVPSYDVDKILLLEGSGMDDQAGDLHNRSLEFAERYEALDIIALATNGLKQMAVDLHNKTIGLVKAYYDVSDIVGIANVGLKEQAIDLHNHTIRHAFRVYDEVEIAALASAGMKSQAAELHNMTI